VEASGFLVVVGFAICVATAVQACLAAGKQGTIGSRLYWLLCAGLAAAWVGGLVVGGVNFYENVRPYYDVTALNVAKNVDPIAATGAGYLDVGSVYFADGTQVREDLSLGFKDGDTYCVAPVGSESQPNATKFTFWAVGLNCCIPSPPAKFWCGMATNYYKVYAGLRWMGDWDKFKLGIQQAGAEYGISAESPVLLTWTRDPKADTDAMRYSGVEVYCISVAVHACLQLAVVLLVFATPLGMLLGLDQYALDIEFGRLVVPGARAAGVQKADTSFRA